VSGVHAILQFGTGRFLQAHVDFFVSQALAAGHALGGIAVVQSTSDPRSSARLAALSRGEGFPVRVRGTARGATVDETHHVDSVREALHAARDWARVRECAACALVIVSNTADAGFTLSEHDNEEVLSDPHRVPRSFPAKLLALLHHRWREAASPVTVMPTELVARNGDTLRGIVVGLARQWSAPERFIDYLQDACVWVNSLVDRIVSEAIEPIGAVAEPYALWAVEHRDRMRLPCRHEAIEVTQDLASHERLKLFVLNLGHTCLADAWLRQDSRPAGFTVLDAMRDDAMRGELEHIWAEEVLPVFDALALGERARRYVGTVRERLGNPFLKHALADIAAHHAEKKKRRIGALLELADSLGLPPHQAYLRRLLTAPDRPRGSFA
jgi:tagaturonate reductase